MPREPQNPVPGNGYHEHDEDAVAFSAASDFDPYDEAEADEESAESVRAKDTFLRAQKRVPIRKGVVTKSTANKLRITVIAAAVVAFVGCSIFAVNVFAKNSP